MKITCHSCEKEYDVPVAGSYCCTCGSAIHVVVPTQANERKEKECPACGEMILESAKKCKHCGEWVDGSHKEPQVIVVQAPHPKSSGLYAVLTVFLGNWGIGEFYIGNYGAGILFFAMNMAGVAILSQEQVAGFILCVVAWFFSLFSMFLNRSNPCFDEKTYSATTNPNVPNQEDVPLYRNPKKKKVYIWLSLLLGFSGAGEFYIENYTTSAIIGLMFFASVVLSFSDPAVLPYCSASWVIAIISMFLNRNNPSFSIKANQ